MPMNVSQVRKLLERRGRVAGERGVKDRAKQLFGKTERLTIFEAKKLIREMEKNKRLALTPKKKAEIEFLLRTNRKLPPPERINFEQISKKTSVSKSQIKKINIGVREGKGKVVATSPERKNVVQNLRKLLETRPNLSFAETAKQLGVTTKQLQRILPQYKTSFASERKNARVNAINQFDIKTSGKLSNAEIAKQLGFKENYVMQNRTRRGRGSGHTTRTRQMSEKFLGIMDFFSGMGYKTISIKTLTQITNTTRPTAHAALKQLKTEKLILEPSQGVYVINEKINGNGKRRRNNFDLSAITNFSIKELRNNLRIIEEIEATVPLGTFDPVTISKIKQKIRTIIARKILN